MISYYLSNFWGLKKVFFVMNAYCKNKYVQKTLFVSLCFPIVFNIQKTLGQDAVFSQYYASSLYLNPAFAATEHTVTAGFNSRVQWKSITTPYNTNQASLIMPIYKSSEKFQNIGGIGLSVYNNKAGQAGVNTTGANLNAAYVIPINEKNQVIAGIQVGFIQKTIDFSKGQWGSQYDPINGFNSSIPSGEYNFVSSVIYPDIGAGFLYYNKPKRDISEKGKSFYMGFSTYHLNRPNESVIKSQPSPLPILYKATLGGEFSINSAWNISPNILIARQSTSLQINIGTYVTYSLGGNSDESKLPTMLIAGAWYRVNDSGIGSIGIGNKYYMIGFSYDMNSSTLRLNTDAKSAGAYEISLKISTPKVVKTQRVYQTPRI
jgi:type IX secretion system PorP/SprF family membrane protein